MKRRWIPIWLFICIVIGILISVGFQSVSAEEPYHYWYAPDNSFGIGETKSVNWTYFRQLWNQYTEWTLEYKLLESSSWADGSQYLTIEKTWNESGFWKFNLVLDVPVDVYAVRFRFAVKRPAVSYFANNDNYEYLLNYTVPGTDEVYRCFFNWSDLVSIPGLDVTKFWWNEWFVFQLFKQGVPAGHYEFDPTFGQTDIEANWYANNNKYQGTYGTPASSGDIDNITVYLGGWGSGEDVICGVYKASDGSLIATSEERDTGGGDGWYVFDVSSGSVVGSTEYLIICHSGAVMNIKYDAENGMTLYLDDAETYSNVLEDPIDWGGTNYSNYAMSIYCSYTEGGAGWSNTCPTLTNFSVDGSVNGSTGIDLYPQLNITVTDADGNNSNVYWSTNGSAKYQINSSVLNTTVYDLNASFVSAYSTTYQINISANDSHCNTSNWFRFTTKAAPWSNTCPSQSDFKVNNQGNGSTGIDLYPQLNITVADADGNNTVVYWSTNGSAKYQINASAGNRTCYDLNFSFASGYLTTYYVEIGVNDTHCNTTAWYVFTTKAAPGVNNCPVSSAESPANKSTDVAICIGFWNVSINDLDGDSTNGTIVCSNGDNTSWSSQANGTRALALLCLNNSVNYTVWLNFTDGNCSVNETYWFVTVAAASGNASCDCDDIENLINASEARIKAFINATLVSGNMNVGFDFQADMYLFIFWAILAFVIVRGRKPFEILAATMVMILFGLWMYMDTTTFHTDYFFYLAMFMVLVGFARGFSMETSDKRKKKYQRFR